MMMKSIETIFQEARAISTPEEQGAFLKKVCGENQALQQKLKALLKAGEQADSFFEQAAFPLGEEPSTLDEKSSPIPLLEDLDLRPKDRIGPYRLMEKVGEGGFGVVWAADQREPIKQRVALKIIKVGMDTKQVVARFEAERQALALMNHPNIAKVLGAGSTESGRPYFCMELIRGIPITQYCDENKLRTQERLDLFTKVCHAIQHAHQKGVIHRDIKPANILVTLHDGVPVPKVIDFGVAKAVEMELTEKTIYTQIQQFIGTPAYMSPEQAEMSGLDIDTRSDIYSLGVLLYELLTGRTPFTAQELMQSGLDEMRRMIREKDPERPSMRLSSLQAEERTSAAQRRSVPLPDLIRSLRGDLDWIVIKALEKDRTRRYETANGMAADIKRHLENEPIVARPPSAAYRLQKAWKRNKGTYVAVVCVFMALLIGTIVSLWQAREAKMARDSENELRKEAEDNADLANLLREKAEQKENQARRLADEMLLRSYAADMKSVQTDLKSDNLNRARITLDRYRPLKTNKDIRDFAWRYYWTQAQGMDRSNFEPHEGIAHYVTYSPDGKLLVTAGFDGQIKVWSTSNLQKPIKAFDYSFDYSDLVYGGHMPFSPDGTRLATVQNGILRIFDTRSWNIIKELETPYGFPFQFASNNLLIQSMPPDKLKIFNLENENQFTIPGQNWNSDGKGTIFVDPYNDNDPTAIYKLPNINPIAQLESSYISNIRFTPSGNYVIHFTYPGILTLRSTKDWAIIHESKAHMTDAWGLAISPDERFIATGGTDQLIKIWEIPTLKHVKTLKGHLNEVWHLSFSKTGRTLVSAGKEWKVRFWDMEEILNQINHSEVYPNENFHRIRTGIQKIWSYSGDFRNPQYWRVSDGRLLKDFQLKDVFPPETIFSEDCTLAAVITSETNQQKDVTKKQLVLLDTASGLISETIQVPSDYINPKCFSPDRHWMVISAANKQSENRSTNQFILYDLLSHREHARFEAAGNIRNYRVPQFSPDGSLLAFRAPDWEVHVWDMEQQKMHSILEGHEWNVYTLSFSSDGSLIATGSIDGFARIWDTDTGQLVTPLLIGHVRGVNRCVFTPDNKILLTSGDDATVRMWSVETGQELALFEGYSGVMLEENGRSLVIQSHRDGKSLQPEIIQIPTLEEIDRTEALRK